MLKLSLKLSLACSMPDNAHIRAASAGSASAASMVARQEMRAPSGLSVGKTGTANRLASMTGVTIVGARSGVRACRARWISTRSIARAIRPPGTSTIVRSSPNAPSPPTSPSSTSAIASLSARDALRTWTARVPACAVLFVGAPTFSTDVLGDAVVAADRSSGDIDSLLLPFDRATCESVLSTEARIYRAKIAHPRNAAKIPAHHVLLASVAVFHVTSLAVCANRGQSCLESRSFRVAHRVSVRTGQHRFERSRLQHSIREQRAKVAAG